MSMASRRNLPSRFDIDMTPLHDFMRNLDSFFNHSFKQMNEHFHFNPFWLDVKEHNTHFTIEADLKGYNKDQIEIEVAGNRIRIAVQDYQMTDQKDTKNSTGKPNNVILRKNALYHYHLTYRKRTSKLRLIRIG